MARRLPGIRGRLELAAVELFAEQGFAATTGAQIAARAGTTERTFYRHFVDKADAAFGDESRLQDHLVDAMRTQPSSRPAWAVTREGFLAITAAIELHEAAFRSRAAVVAANPALRDREIVRAVDWASLVVRALTERDTDPASAELCAAMWLSLFRLATRRWVADAGGTLTTALQAAERDAHNELEPSGA